MKNSLNVPVVLGTAREGRESEAVAGWLISKLVGVDEIDEQLVDVRSHLFSYTHPGWKEYPATADWQNIADTADGFIIVTPEYNHGYPGELKILLDSAYKHYFDKPVALVGVSNGGWGGTRVVEALKPTLIELGMTPMGRALYFPKVEELFNSDGTIKNSEQDRYDENFEQWVKPFINYAQHFRGIRE